MSLPTLCAPTKAVFILQNLRFSKNRLFSAKKMEKMVIRQASSSSSKVQPYEFLERDLREMYELMTEEVADNVPDKKFQKVCTYYFDFNDSWITSDSFAARATFLLSGAINNHLGINEILEKQKQLGRLAEMALVAITMSDDALENAEVRKGIPSVNRLYGARGAMMGAMMLQNIAIKIASKMESKECMDAIIESSSMVISEFLQYEIELNDDLMTPYLHKTYLKTAHYAALTGKAVAVLAGADDQLVEKASQIARNLAMAAQLVDDLQDYVSTPETLGKHTGADLRDGIVTAPVIYAYEKYPDKMRPLILRRFQGPEDHKMVLDLIHKANAIGRMKKLINNYIEDANSLIRSMKKSPYQKSLLIMWDKVFKKEV